MGANVSNQSISSLSRIITNTLNKSITNIKNTVNVKQYIKQDMDLAIDSVNCDLHISQEGKLIGNLVLKNNAKLIQQVKNDAASKLQELVKNKLDQVNKGLNLGQMNIANVHTTTNTFIENNLSNIIRDEISSTISSSSDIDQKITLHVGSWDCKEGSTISQSGIIKTLASNISTSIVDNFMTNKSVTDIQKKVEQSVSQKNIGLDFSIILVLVIVGGYFIGKKFLGKKTEEK